MFLLRAIIRLTSTFTPVVSSKPSIAAMCGWFRRQHFGFALETCEPLGIGSERGWERLDGDLAFQLRVGRAIDLTHAADAKRIDDLVGAKLGAGRQHRECWGIIGGGLISFRRSTMGTPFRLTSLMLAATLSPAWPSPPARSG